jgi:hypothetical protein
MMSSTYFAERDNLSGASTAAEEGTDFSEPEPPTEDEWDGIDETEAPPADPKSPTLTMHKAREVASRAGARVSATVKRFTRRTDDFFSEDAPEE